MYLFVNSIFFWVISKLNVPYLISFCDKGEGGNSCSNIAELATTENPLRKSAEQSPSDVRDGINCMNSEDRDALDESETLAVILGRKKVVPMFESFIPNSIDYVRTFSHIANNFHVV